MTIFGRYVFRQAAGALTLILLSLSGVVWIALALRQLNLVTTEGQDALTFIKMTTLALPNMMGMIAPIALLVAVIHTLNRLSGDSELIVLTASGASTWTIARPLLVLACVIAGLVSFVNHVGMPWSLKLLREYVIQMRSDLIGQVIQPGRFSSPEPGLTFHIRERAMDGRLLGLVMHDTRDQKTYTSYLAETSMLIKQDGQPFLLMQNGHVLRRVLPPNDPPQIIEFESYVVDLERFEPKAGHNELKPRERYFMELAFPRPDDPDFKRNPGQFRAEFHERFANPFYALAFVLLAVAFMGRAQSTRQNRWHAVALAGAISVGARVGGLAANNLVVINAKWVPLLYAIPLGLILVSVLMMQFGGRNNRPSRLGAMTAAGWEASFGRLAGLWRRPAVAGAARGTVADAGRGKA
jgi:lipopolysaccharide export system permease protein